MAWMTRPKIPYLKRSHFNRHIQYLIIKMAGQGASLQNYNNELVKCIEDLRERRNEVQRQIVKDEELKAKIQQELALFTKKLTDINDDLAKKNQTLNEYNRTIAETEGAYMKILESSQTLLQVLRRETGSLAKKKF
jgi:Sjoegren syndrome nuclear autoantigen 1